MSSDGAPLVQVRNLHKVFKRGSERIDVLQGVDLDLAQGEYLSLMGPSGSGKTTLLNLIGGLDTPTGGSVTVGGDRIDRLSAGKLSRWRARHIGFVFQLYNLLPVLTAERNVELPLLLTPLTRAQRKRHVATALAMVDLSERSKHYPRQLSGGQEQRVGIARAIVTDPTLLLCDEPTGDLDRKSGDEILDLLQALNEEHGKTIVMVTHDARAATRAGRTLHLDKGTLVDEGTLGGGDDVKFLPLVWSNLFRRKMRTIFTLLSIVIAFVLFNYLSAVSAAFTLGVDVAGADRLTLIHKVSFIQLLPESYKDRILSVDGVNEVTHATWFGGVYQDPTNFFAQFAVEPEAYLSMYPEFLLSDDAKQRWFRNRTGAVVGRATADRFGWEVGDRIPLQGTIWRTRSGPSWELTIDGIYEGAEQATDDTQFLFHYDYLAEANTMGRGFVGWYMIKVDDPSRGAEIGNQIDARFANSPFETKTSTEQAFVQAFASQIGDIGAMMTAIMVAVLFTILLVAANTMGQSVRERTNELAVLKTLGFNNAAVLTLVLLESVLLAVVGGGIGLGISWLIIINRGDPTGGLLPAFFVSPRDLVIGVGLMLFLGVASGIVPAVQAVRLRIVDALRHA